MMKTTGPISPCIGEHINWITLVAAASLQSATDRLDYNMVVQLLCGLTEASSAGPHLQADTRKTKTAATAKQAVKDKP